jgi:hypothetical protein
MHEEDQVDSTHVPRFPPINYDYANKPTENAYKIYLCLSKAVPVTVIRKSFKTFERTANERERRGRNSRLRRKD